MSTMCAGSGATKPSERSERGIHAGEERRLLAHLGRELEPVLEGAHIAAKAVALHRGRVRDGVLPHPREEKEEHRETDQERLAVPHGASPHGVTAKIGLVGTLLRARGHVSSG
jgi:hypothetical protein